MSSSLCRDVHGLAAGDGHGSTKWAPWHVVPANKKWARDCVVARAMVEALESLPLRWPKPKTDLSRVVIR